MPRKKRHQRVKLEADPPSPGSLPSRSEVQRRKKKKKKKKIRKKKSVFPLIKILAAFFIFMPLLVILLMDIFEKKTLPLIKEISNGYETVSIVPHSTAPLKTEEQEVQEQTTVASDAGEDQTGEKKKTVADETEGIKQSYHVVVPGDTLFTIAITYYHSSEGMEIIREWNQLDSDEVQLGQKLKVPVKE